MLFCMALSLCLLLKINIEKNWADFAYLKLCESKKNLEKSKEVAWTRLKPHGSVGQRPELLRHRRSTKNCGLKMYLNYLHIW